MKRGASGDPFSSSDESDEDDAESEPPEAGSDGTEGGDAGSAGAASSEIPYVLRRSEVKEGRKDTSFPLQASTRDLEKQAAPEISSKVGVDVPLSDVREVAYLVGLQHQDEVVEQLLEWGYEHRR